MLKREGQLGRRPGDYTLRHPEDSTRRALFAQLFKGLGHQMHLVQNIAVPYHVRNDAHAEDAFIEYNSRGFVELKR